MFHIRVNYILLLPQKREGERGIFSPSPNIDQEPRGVNLAGKVTNFLTYHGVGHGSKCKELDDWQAPSGGCGQGRSFSFIAPIRNVKAYDFAHFSKLG